MTKHIFNTAIDNTTDTGFRTWATELYGGTIASGVVQAADTGQLAVPVSAPRPNNGAYAGYWIFRFADALQGTAPIFFKVQPGRGSIGNAIRILVQVGTGSDGAGNITGSIGSFEVTTSSVVGTIAATPSYFNHADGFFAFAFKSGAVTSGLGFLMIARTTDGSGNPTGEGVFVLGKTGAALGTAVCAIFGGFSVTASDSSWCCPMFPRSATQIGSNYQAYRVYGAFPEARVIPQLVAILQTELPVGSQTGAFEVLPGVNRNYLAVGPAGAGLTAVGGQTFQMCIPWD